MHFTPELFKERDRLRSRLADAERVIEAAKLMRGPHVSGVGLVNAREGFDSALREFEKAKGTAP